MLAVVFGADGQSLPVTAGMLQEQVAASAPEHTRNFASWLAVAHLRCLATDPDYLR